MSSTAGDFRYLTPLVLMSALQRAGTAVHEPAPVQDRPCGGAVRRDPAGAGEAERGPPSAERRRLELPTPTRREGLLVSTFERHAELNGVAPVRPRTDHNPLDRAAYVLVVRR